MIQWDTLFSARAIQFVKGSRFQESLLLFGKISLLWWPFLALLLSLFFLFFFFLAHSLAVLYSFVLKWPRQTDIKNYSQNSSKSFSYIWHFSLLCCYSILALLNILWLCCFVCNLAYAVSTDDGILWESVRCTNACCLCKAWGCCTGKKMTSQVTVFKTYQTRMRR